MTILKTTSGEVDQKLCWMTLGVDLHSYGWYHGNASGKYFNLDVFYKNTLIMHEVPVNLVIFLII